MAICKHILSILFLLQSFSTLQSINVTSSLVANENNSSWISPSSEFAFGFRKLPNSSNLFLLAIWFVPIPERTIIWHAKNDSNPVFPQGSELKLTEKGLVLTDPNGQVRWIADTGNATVSSAEMLNTGNFVLAGNNTNPPFLWESFKNPTDTILPSQVLDSNTVLRSMLSETNFSTGRFVMNFSDGDLRLSPAAWPTPWRYKAYYNQTCSNSNSSVFDCQLVFNESTSEIYLGKTIELDWESPIQAMQPTPVENYYHRATLDYYGVFTQYVYPKSAGTGGQRWSVVRYIPDDICTDMVDDFGSGVCGYNSYCSKTPIGEPACRCPVQGYSFIDQNNPFGGCQPNFPLGCGSDDASDNLGDLYELQDSQGVNWPRGDYERLEPFEEEECTNSCLQDCLCAVVVYGGKTCWKKQIPLSNGRQERNNTKIFFKVRKKAFSSECTDLTCKEKKEDDNKSVLLGSLGSSLVVNAVLIIVVLLLIIFLKRKSNKSAKVSTLLETHMHMFSYKELVEATDNFKEQLGRGSSAVVFKGTLQLGSNDTNVVIAVKKLDKLSEEAEKEFKTELKAIGMTCHKNLVRLIGFCEEGHNRLLVYEYMMNGTLSGFLLGESKPGWNMRSKISLEIARGLVYLHDECEVPIIHCDIKPENILLDETFTARISDFGLVKLLQSNQSRTLTNIRGTRGYVAPEWFRSGAITAKIDVYSFGVVLLEIICCRKNVSKVEDEKEGILVDWIYDCFVNGRLDFVVQFDKEATADRERVIRWVCIALWCIQEDPSKRPSMKMVLQMLEGFVEVPVPPIQPFIISFN